MSYLIPAPAAFTYSATAPSSPVAGDRWYDSDLGIEYTYVNDGDTSQWVETSPGGIVGPTGDTGATGATGSTGATGAQGNPGVDGGGSIAAITSATGSISTSETKVVSYSAGANTLTAGAMYRITGLAKRTGTNNSGATFRVRIGPTTLTGNIASTVTLGNATTELGLLIEMWVGIQTTGAAGTTTPGGATTIYGASTALGSTTASVAVDTTVTNLIEFTAVTANAINSFVFGSATIEKVK